MLRRTPAPRFVLPAGLAATLILSAFAAAPVSAAPAIDVAVSADGSGTRTTQTFSTAAAGELLVAFVGSDGPMSSQSVTVSGGGLAWTLVKRANAQFGTAEIWQAFASSRLANVSVTSRQTSQSYYQSLTVVAFTGASGIGASTTRSASSGAPSATIRTTQANSWVFGVGFDWARATARTLGASQTMVHQYLATATGATAWVQRTNATTPLAGTNVTISDTYPTSDRYDLAVGEILAAATVDTTAPTITSVTPAAGATGIAATTKPTVTFSEAMNAATITASTIVLEAGGSPVPASVTYNTTAHVATLAPATSLASLTTYTAIVNGGSDGVKDAAGNALESDYQWSFTSADTMPPTITGVAPSPGATGVSAAAKVTAAFSEAMSAATISTSTFTLQNGAASVPATVSYDSAQRIATLTPNAPLASGSAYTATVKGGSSGVKDAAGNALAANVQWGFAVADTSAPTVTSVSPASGASDVPAGTTVSVTFSEAIDPATVTGVSFSLQSDGGTVGASVAYTAATHVATLTPDAPLALSTTYTATVAGGPDGIADLAGNTLASSVVWSFSTPEPDTTAPVLTSSTPSGSKVPTSASATATFSEPIDPATLTAASFFVLNGETPVQAALTYDEATHTAALKPSSLLAMTTTYTVTVKGGSSGIADLAGNPLAEDASWTFTTAADSVPPVLTSKTPASGATGIPNTAVVTVAFSEALDPATVNTSTFALHKSTGDPVDATVSYDAVTNVVTIIPSAVLANSTKYTATVLGGSSGATDLGGNPIDATVTWSFTTSGTLTPSVQVSVNRSSIRQTMEGLGGDYAFGYAASPTEYSPVASLMTETLHPAHARMQMYLPEWEPSNDNSNSQIFNWGAFQDVGYTHLNFVQMQDFQRRGIPMVITVWDAPNWMVSNPGSTTGRIIPSTMWGEAIESMAGYLLYARDQYGVTVPYMSMNEVDGGYSLYFSTSSLNAFIKQAMSRFAALGLTTKWLVGETANPGGVVGYSTPLLQDSVTRQYLGPISVHTWNPASYSDSTFTSIYNLAVQYNRPVWVEELGIDPQGYDNTKSFSYALSIANLYRRMLTLLHATVVDYWEYGDDFDLADPATLAPYPAFYAIKPLTDYLRPGTDVVNVSSSSTSVAVLAGKDDARHTAIVYAINNGTSAATVSFSGLPPSVMTLLRTTATQNMATIGSYNPVNGTLTLTLPAQSINALVAGDPDSAISEVTQ